MKGKPGQAGLSVSSAFTIVELLVVIGVIAILISILIPSVKHVRLRAMATQSQARINGLADGAEAYHQDHSLYPGQFYSSLWRGNYTGTQVLGACLFGYSFNEIDGAPEPTNAYAQYQEDDLITYRGKKNSVSDRFALDPMTVLYYPSQLAITGMNQYVWEDNSDYLYYSIAGGEEDTNSGFHKKALEDSKIATPEEAFVEYITDPRFAGASAEPYKPGEFLLIGAGVDRLFGTTDDLKNW